MEQSTQDRAPDVMTENRPALGPVVFIPLLVILAAAMSLVVWIMSA